MELKRLLELAGVPQAAEQLDEAKKVEKCEKCECDPCECKEEQEEQEEVKECACGCVPDKCKCKADCKKCKCNAVEEEEECNEEEEECKKEGYDFGSLERLRFLAGLSEAGKYDEPKANHSQKLGGKKCKDPKEGKGKAADSGKYKEPKADNKVKSGGDSVKSKEGKLKVPSKSKYTDHNSTK